MDTAQIHIFDYLNSRTFFKENQIPRINDVKDGIVFKIKFSVKWESVGCVWSDGGSVALLSAQHSYPSFECQKL